MQTLTETPQTYKIGKWRIEVYVQRNELWCVSPNGKVFIIRESVYNIVRIPQYVRKGLMRRGLLENWKQVQGLESLRRLREAQQRYEKYLKRVENGTY